MRLMLGIALASLGLSALPLHAQVNTPASAVTDTQVAALVEALRLAAPRSSQADDGLYTEWRIVSANIPRWSKQCVGRELTPKEFEANPITARSIVGCIMKDTLQEQYRASENNETVAVQRAASWWMTGDPTSYKQTQAAGYTQKVLGFYQQLRSQVAAIPPAPITQQPPASPAPQATATPTTQQPPVSSAPQTTATPTTQQPPVSSAPQTTATPATQQRAASSTPRTTATPATQQRAASSTPRTTATPAPVAKTQVATLVEALRQAAPRTGRQNDGMYSEWKVLPGNIPRWSRQCIGRELTPQEFEANSQRARSILECVMVDILQQQLRASGNNEPIAIQRAAAWWMTGDATRYQQQPTSAYTQRVLQAYQQLRSNRSTQR